jgi:hypothetical protein
METSGERERRAEAAQKRWAGTSANSSGTSDLVKRVD